MPTEYDKLVRDRIPELVETNGETPVTRRVEGEEYGDYLAEKLVEEAREFRDARATDGEDPDAELADVLEVMETLLDRGDRDRVRRLREEKVAERGGFAEGIVLERVEDGG
ncbi:nucleoside triphosphate pyrophosphohydrolase [Halorarum halophilum]|uniref:Nucleoside triphosphate pyrophosphohydrolase n=1 Tax=Halorarum halophilum TaxID=2743090 RepID=A0A7D5KV80_9EURY|nr:nucleoside triphosphate pyrophosphohydrolase [Halobaculum halophilum]QLG28520.1 nucleoside triphosphate pyrophosphohydrolase [Halobaculum halophilum]